MENERECVTMTKKAWGSAITVAEHIYASKPESATAESEPAVKGLEELLSLKPVIQLGKSNDEEQDYFLTKEGVSALEALAMMVMLS